MKKTGIPCSYYRFHFRGNINSIFRNWFLSLMSSRARHCFPGMRPADVVSEVFFTFISLVILFEVNTLLFHFNQPAVKSPGRR